MGGGGSRSGESMDEDESTTSPPEPAVSGFTSGIFASRLAAISDTFRLTNGGAAASEDGYLGDCRHGQSFFHAL